jgi:hypothetical protein
LIWLNAHFAPLGDFRMQPPPALVSKQLMACGGAAIAERPERTAQGHRWFRCRDRGKQFDERTGGSLNRTRYPSDVLARVVFWRLRCKPSLRDLPEMFRLRGIESTYAAAEKFFRSAKAVTALTPTWVTTDGHDSHPRAIRSQLGVDVRHRNSQYLTDVFDKTFLASGAIFSLHG